MQVDAAVSGGAADIGRDPEGAVRTLAWLDLYRALPKAYSAGMMDVIIKTKIPKEQRASLIVDSLKTPTDIGISMLTADLYGKDRLPVLAKFACPTLVIAAGEGPNIPSEQSMMKHLAHGHLVIVPNAGHAVFIDQPDRFGQLLKSFMD